MRNLLLFVFLLNSTITFAQSIDQPSVGNSYANQTFYTLNDGTTKTNANTAWDIAFDVSPGGAGVLVNESVGLSFTGPLPEVELYYSGSTDFATADTTGMTRLYNPEINWTSGAFNSVATPGNQVDLGWGDYTFGSGVFSTRVFFIRLRNGLFQKIEIQSLVSGVYTFRHADYDGSNEVSYTVDKANYPNRTLAYFSLETGTALDLEPEKWDLLFTRYYTLLDDGTGTGNMLNYMVTGVLHNANVSVAQADNIDPATVDHNNYTSYSDTLNKIGHDWKFFDFQTGWGIEQNRVYFVQNSDSLWKVQFLDFEGSSTGITTLERTFETLLVSTNGLYDSFESFEVYPNPVIDHVNIAFELKVDSRDANLTLRNALGQTILNQNVWINNGLNVLRLPIDVSTGVYYLSLEVDNEIITKPVFVK